MRLPTKQDKDKDNYKVKDKDKDINMTLKPVIMSTFCQLTRTNQIRPDYPNHHCHDHFFMIFA